MAHAGGRPTTYNQETATKLCEYIVMGYSLRKACEQEGMPVPSTFFDWIREHEEFSKQYTRATEERSEAMAEDMLAISDDTREDKDAVAKAKLQVETRKWLMAKMKPKKYGDKIDVTSDGKALPTPILGGLSKESEGGKDV